MLEKMGHIRNPLTIIAMFAALAEISGTAVLPFIGETNQGPFVLFLILFPSVLILLFFLTLNFNHKVLYAPSDYKDEENFLKLLNRASAAVSDTYAALAQVKDLALCISEPIVSSLMMVDRPLQYMHVRYKISQIKAIEDALRKLGATQNEILEVTNPFFNGIKADHAKRVFYSLKTVESKHALVKDIDGRDYDALSSSDIQELMQKEGVAVEGDVLEALEDYKFFEQKREVRREEKWQG